MDSVTIFAKCHHGWSYYPTTVGAPHPQLTRDLMGDMVKALTAADIECPIYISVQWDERNARLHPEWRARSATKNRFDPGQLQAGWHTLCLNHKEYRDELLAQAREIATNYATPGYFSISCWHPIVSARHVSTPWPSRVWIRERRRSAQEGRMGQRSLSQ